MNIQMFMMHPPPRIPKRTAPHPVVAGRVCNIRFAPVDIR